MHRVIRDNTPEGHLSVSDFAREAGIKPQRVRYMIQRRWLAYKKVGMYFFIPRSELTRHRKASMRESLKELPLDCFDYARGCGPAPEVV